MAAHEIGKRISMLVIVFGIALVGIGGFQYLSNQPLPTANVPIVEGYMRNQARAATQEKAQKFFFGGILVICIGGGIHWAFKSKDEMRA